VPRLWHRNWSSCCVPTSERQATREASVFESPEHSSNSQSYQTQSYLSENGKGGSYLHA
jgi:hypothetical protein